MKMLYSDLTLMMETQIQSLVYHARTSCCWVSLDMNWQESLLNWSYHQILQPSCPQPVNITCCFKLTQDHHISSKIHFTWLVTDIISPRANQNFEICQKTENYYTRPTSQRTQSIDTAYEYISELQTYGWR